MGNSDDENGEICLTENSMAAQNTTWALVQRICHVQDILIREPLYGHARWDEIHQQAIVAFESCAKGNPLAVQILNHATFFQRKIVAGYTYVLHCVRMDVIHRDCSFVDDF
ncbi:hypothetical protein, partial [uncultured Mitsuokella sp.]|uniref:hypothetical protein n=1 Tax=uncultured Mitsuokella sp. TaxID=453120 RepID=UPI0025E87B4E